VGSKVIQVSIVQLLLSVESLALYVGVWNMVQSSVQRDMIVIYAKKLDIELKIVRISTKTGLKELYV
jgi:hypothetical protein